MEGESGCVHIAAACRRGCNTDRHAMLYYAQTTFFFGKQHLGNFDSGPD